jgi:hypothetical protein
MASVCTGTSIRMKSGLHQRTCVHGCLRFNWRTLIPVFQFCIGPFPLSAYSHQHHDWTPAKRSCSATHSGAKRSFGLLQTLVRLSVKSTHNLDSWVKRTGVQSLTAHVTWVCAHCKRFWIRRCVKGMQIACLRDLNPSSCNLFLTVCLLTRSPVAFWKSFYKVVAFENRLRLAWRTINRSWAWVVERSRPPAWPCKTFPVIWNRFHILGIPQVHGQRVFVNGQPPTF